MTSTSPTSATGSSGGETQQKKGDAFKPLEAKDHEELTLESLRASKLTPQTSSDDVRAPGIYERVKEEVEAIAESIEEDMNSKSSQGGCFSWFGFGGFHKHHQSQ